MHFFFYSCEDRMTRAFPVGPMGRFFGAAACAILLSANAASAADIDNGERLAQRWCASCHIVDEASRDPRKSLFTDFTYHVEELTVPAFPGLTIMEGWLEVCIERVNGDLDWYIEGIQLDGKPVFSVQYHPEAGPGPHDSRYLFNEFRQLMEAK